MSQKIKVQNVDKNYIIHPKCRTKPGNETTLLGADQLYHGEIVYDLNKLEF